MSIFKTHYDNSLVSVDTAWSPYEDCGLNVKFAHGPFTLDFNGAREYFLEGFKEDFTAFYEKVMKDYDEVTGKSNTFEKCFDAMLDDMTEINYRPEPKQKKIPINFYEYVKEIKQGLELAGIKNFDICEGRFLVSKDDPYSGFDLMICIPIASGRRRISNGRFG